MKTATTPIPASRAAASSVDHCLQIFEPAQAGVPAYVANLAAGLIDRGWRVSVIAPGDNSAMDDLRRCGAQIVPMPIAPLPAPSDVAVLRAAARVCAIGACVIHGHSTKASLLAALASRLTRVPSVYSPHFWAFERPSHRLTRAAMAAFERRMSRTHRQIVAVSESERAEAERTGIRAPVEVVPTGLPDDGSAPARAAARASLGLAADAAVALWVGRRAPQKRPGDLALIAAKLRERGVHLVAIGYGLSGSPEGDALRSAGGRVVEGFEPATLYAAADVLVQTSAWESTSIAVLEAMRAGLPVVAYRAGGISDQVSPGVTGYLVPIGAVDELTSLIVRTVSEPGLRAAFGEAARSRYDTMFSFNKMVDSIEAIYRSVTR